jgi:hypothetical protein
VLVGGLVRQFVGWWMDCRVHHFVDQNVGVGLIEVILVPAVGSFCAQQTALEKWTLRTASGSGG